MPQSVGGLDEEVGPETETCIPVQWEDVQTLLYPEGHSPRLASIAIPVWDIHRGYFSLPDEIFPRVEKRGFVLC